MVGITTYKSCSINPPLSGLTMGLFPLSKLSLNPDGWISSRAPLFPIGSFSESGCQLTSHDSVYGLGSTVLPRFLSLGSSVRMGM